MSTDPTAAAQLFYHDVNIKKSHTLDDWDIFPLAQQGVGNGV